MKERTKRKQRRLKRKEWWAHLAVGAGVAVPADAVAGVAAANVALDVVARRVNLAVLARVLALADTPH